LHLPAHDRYEFDIEDMLPPPPLSLSAPELNIGPEPILRPAVSSTELLYERAMARFYQAVALFYVCILGFTLCVVVIQYKVYIIQIAAHLQEADRVADNIAKEEATSSGNDQDMQFLKQEKEFELPIPAFQISKVRPPVSMMDDNTTSSTATTSFAKLKVDPNMLGSQPHKTAIKENKVTKVNLPHKNGNSMSYSTNDEPPKKIR
jgi:hypothetical protein